MANSSRWAGVEVVASALMKNSWAHATLSTEADLVAGQTCTVLRVLVIAKDEPGSASACPLGDIEVTVSVPPSMLLEPPARAELLLLTAPALDSRNDINWAGQSFDNSTDGRPIGYRTEEPVPARAAGEYAFTLPQLSAAILVMKKCSE